MPLILINTILLCTIEKKKSTNYDMPLIIKAILISEYQNVGENYVSLLKYGIRVLLLTFCMVHGIWYIFREEWL